MRYSEEELEEFNHSYMRTMLWANVWSDNMDENDDPLGFGSGPGENHADYLISTMPEALVEEMRADCRIYLDSLAPVIIRLATGILGYGGFDQAGHDFAMTRNGHGAGFWDRGIGAAGDALTNKAEALVGRNVYVEDPHDATTWTYESA